MNLAHLCERLFMRDRRIPASLILVQGRTQEPLSDRGKNVWRVELWNDGLETSLSTKQAEMLPLTEGKLMLPGSFVSTRPGKTFLALA